MIALHRNLLPAAALLVLLAACQIGGPPPPASTTTALAPEASTSRLVDALEAAGLDVEQRPDGLRVTTDDPRFVRCLPVNVRGGSGDGSRKVFTQVSERRGVLDVRIVGGGERTQVSWQPRFTGRYRNRVNNTFFERPCESTGELERLLATTLSA